MLSKSRLRHLRETQKPSEPAARPVVRVRPLRRAWTDEELYPAGVPSIEQLERTWETMLGLPMLPDGMRPDHWEELLRIFHRLVQRSALGDGSAVAEIERLRAMVRAANLKSLVGLDG